MCDPFIGQIMMFAGDFAPRGWALCDGQLLSIAENNALFTILGTRFGGDGVSTFALPDLRGRVPIHPGTGPGLTPRVPGQMGGQETVTLGTGELPRHSHAAVGSLDKGENVNPGEKTWAVSQIEDKLYASRPNVKMHKDAIRPSGQGNAHKNMQPYLCINYIIALQGLYPSRS